MSKAHDTNNTSGKQASNHTSRGHFNAVWWRID